jgi:hypothetical protein
MFYSLSSIHLDGFDELTTVNYSKQVRRQETPSILLLQHSQKPVPVLIQIDILPSTPGSSNGLLPSCLPTKTLYLLLFYPIRSTYSAHISPLVLITEWYLVRSTEHKAFLYGVFFTFPILVCCTSKYPLTSYFRTPSAYVPPSVRPTKFHTHTK